LEWVPSSSAFTGSGLLPSAAKGWTRLDVIGTAISQINAAKEIDPTFIVMHTNDWWSLALTKDSYGGYILGDPQSLTVPRVFGLTVSPDHVDCRGNIFDRQRQSCGCGNQGPSGDSR
jgi:hypothetical protein